MGFSSVIGASSVIRPGVCTSTTRPSSPYDGQVIYETDTDQVRAWDGAEWELVGPASTPGLVQIVPTVSGSGVTISQTGKITVSAATSAVITGAFPTTYDNFRIIFSDLSGTIGQECLFRLRGATTVTSNYRGAGRYVVYGGAAGDVNSFPAHIPIGSSQPTGKTNTIVDLLNPNSAVITGYISNTSNYDAWVSYAGQNTNTTAYENAEVSVASGTFSCSISIYGYRK